MWNWSKPIKFPHLWKLDNQSTLNKAHVVEIWRQEIPSLFDIERNVSIGKKNSMVKICFLKLLANRFWLTSQSCSWFNKVIYGRPSIKWTSWKGNDRFTSSRLDVQLVPSAKKWSLANRWKKRSMIKINNGFYT